MFEIKLALSLTFLLIWVPCLCCQWMQFPISCPTTVLFPLTWTNTLPSATYSSGTGVVTYTGSTPTMWRISYAVRFNNNGTGASYQSWLFISSLTTLYSVNGAAMNALDVISSTASVQASQIGTVVVPISVGTTLNVVVQSTAPTPRIFQPSLLVVTQYR